MKAIVFTQYGPPTKVMRLAEVERPVPKADEVLIHVRAAAVNDWDWEMVRGRQWIMRLLIGLRKPKIRIPGVDVAGEVIEVGENVRRFKPGDAVYGDLSENGFGGFAEYVCAKENALVHKPGNMSFEQAAAIPHAAILAVQGLFHQRQIQPGQKVLINGAGGGVGTFAIQLIRELGADLTAVDSADKLPLLRQMGYQHVIDYQQEDFTCNGQQYDLILDTKTNRSPFAYARSLKQGGTYATVGGSIPRLLSILMTSPIISLFQKKKLRIVSLKPNRDLQLINQLFEQGKIRPVIDGPYSLKEIPELIQYFGAGKHTGKVVIRI
ncbi:MAG: NAD(P)-dependent alcohol dehydrogenase [Bacteroidota bacterium]